MGYFDKLRQADVFVYLDTVQFQKTGGNWTNRVQMLVNGAPWWLTVPVHRNYSGVRAIAEIEINDATPWRKKALETLRLNYRRAPAFDEVFEFVEPLVSAPEPRLADWNIGAIDAIADRLGLGAKRVRASELDSSGASTDLLASLVIEVGGDRYLYGGGAGGYQDDGVLRAAGVTPVPQDFTHPRYEQAGADEFAPGLSILDCLFRLGFDETAALLGSP